MDLQKCVEESKNSSDWRSLKEPGQMCSKREATHDTILNSKMCLTFKLQAKNVRDSSAEIMPSAQVSLTSPLLSIHDVRRCWLALVVLLMAAECGATQVGGAGADDVLLADQYLAMFGYYQQPSHPQQPHEIYRVPEDKELQNDQPKMSTSEHTDADRSDAVRRLQSFFHLPVTGRLDEATRGVMRSPRCGVSDVVDSSGDTESVHVDVGQKRRAKRYAFYTYSDGSPAKWEMSELTWGITRYSQQISESKQRDVIRQALAVWAQHVPVRFVETRGADEPDINVMFGSRQHGPYNDPEFDGSNVDLNVLAHAWGPSRKAKGFSGDVHFDNDDNWSNANTFLNVAVHELGHSMGLVHSKDESAIMFPVYRETSELNQDDINGIRAIYRSNGRPQPLTPRPQPVTRRPQPVTPRPQPVTRRPQPVTPRPQPVTRRPQPVTYRPVQTPRPLTRSPPYKTRRPEVTYRPDERRPYYTDLPDVSTYPTDPAPEDVCSTVHVDALFEDPDSPSTYIVITGDHVHKMSSRGQLISSDTLSNAYPDVPSDIDVAFSLRSNRNVYFIKDSKMWVYNNNQLVPDSPRAMNNFPEAPRFSTPLTDARGTTRLILFGDTTWWIFEESGAGSHSSPLSSFVNRFPSDVMFAVRWIDNYVYAISPTSYVKIDQDKRLIIHEDPIPGVPDWLRALCNSGNRSLPQASMTVLLILTAIVSSFSSLTS